MSAMKLTSTRRCLTAVALALSIHFGGCAAPPPIRLHSLLSIDSRARASSALLPGFAYTLTAVSVPPQVDQPQWLVRNADGTLSLLEQERWAAPLRSELQSALLDRWISSWGGRSAAASPASDNAWRVTLDVMRWEAWPGREVRLESRWSATSGAFALNCRSVIREAASGGNKSTVLALADSQRRAVIRLADEVASRIDAAQKGEPVRCADVTM